MVSAADSEPIPHDEEDEVLHHHPELADELNKLFHGLDRLAECDATASGTADKDEALSSKNRPLGDFRIVREIGSGGMAKVFEAEQISLKRKVALKVLSPHLSLSEKAVQKFYREAIAGARPRHPNIVAVYAMGEYDGIHYIVQELLEEGKTLADLLDHYRKGGNHHRGYFLKMARITAEVADALEHAHGAGVIHRDVKPSNILLTHDGRPKVSDFGLSRVEGALALSKSGVFSGTPYYMSPEQAGSSRSGIDHRTDVFSLGVTLYEALTLERAFDGATSQEVLKKVLFHEPRNPRSSGRPVPRDLALICMKALEKDPNHRYQTMGEFSADLRCFLSGESIQARPDNWPRRVTKWIRRHKARTVTMAALLVATLAVMHVLLFYSKMKEEEHRDLEARFKGIGEALGWPRYDATYSPIFWYIDADPTDPGGYMLHALIAFKSGSLEAAEEHLSECIRRCEERDEAPLERDAWYLLGLVKHRLGARESNPEDSSRLFEEARYAFMKMKGIDTPPLQDGLVWPHEDAYAEVPGDSNWLFKPVRINEQHPVVRMHEGLTLFHRLFKGGEKKDFQTAIEHFEAVLEKQPANHCALTFLARVQFFYARFYNYLHLLDEAEENVRLALRLQGEHPYTMACITLGQILDFCGDEDQAMELFQKAYELGKNEDRNMHNPLCGMGKICMRRGEHDKALDYLKKADSVQPNDCHVNVALAWLHLKMDDPDAAIDYASAAEERYYPPTRTQRRTHYCTVDIVQALAQLRKEQYDEAICCLRKSTDAITSPRDLCQATFLLFTLPKDKTGAVDAYVPARNASYFITDSPICMSARAIHAYDQERFGECINYLELAIVERKKWSEKTRRYHALEDARDHYLMAMAHYRLAQERGGGDEAYLDDLREAEALIRQEHVPYEYSEIVHRIRAKAKALIE
jgi:tetratricopeptide (TPR) repeat protein